MKNIVLLCFYLLTSVASQAERYYWTSDGQQHILTLQNSGNNECYYSIPAEAVAIDLRGGNMATVSVDVAHANPNCLYYLDKQECLPQGLNSTLNLIYGLNAPHVKVVDSCDYYCPQAFHADFVSFLMQPSYDSVDDEWRGCGYSETLMLPFHVSYACLYDINGEADILHADMLKMLRYEGHHADTLTWWSLSAINQTMAYEPYILGVYIGSRLLFMGENINVPQTSAPAIAREGYCFIGTTVRRELSQNAFLYDPSDNSFVRAEDKQLIHPFRGYIQTFGLEVGNDAEADDHLNLPANLWGPQGDPSNAAAIDDLRMNNEQCTMNHEICDLQGRQVRATANCSLFTSLKKGIYIVSGRKVIVK